MIKVYLKQAWELLKQNKLFSMLYIVGTGLAIAMTMVMAMVYYVKIAPVYPEVNRLNTLYLTSCKMETSLNISGRYPTRLCKSGSILPRMHFVFRRSWMIGHSRTAIYSLPTLAGIFR